MKWVEPLRSGRAEEWDDGVVIWWGLRAVGGDNELKMLFMRLFIIIIFIKKLFLKLFKKFIFLKINQKINNRNGTC